MNTGLLQKTNIGVRSVSFFYYYLFLVLWSEELADLASPFSVLVSRNPKRRFVCLIRSSPKRLPYFTCRATGWQFLRTIVKKERDFLCRVSILNKSKRSAFSWRVMSCVLETRCTRLYEETLPTVSSGSQC